MQEGNGAQGVQPQRSEAGVLGTEWDIDTEQGLEKYSDVSCAVEVSLGGIREGRGTSRVKNNGSPKGEAVGSPSLLTHQVECVPHCGDGLQPHYCSAPISWTEPRGKDHPLP